MTDRDIIDARAAVQQFFEALANTDGFDERLAQKYHWMRQALSLQFQSMAHRDLSMPTLPLALVRDQIRSEMQLLFGGSADEFLLTVRGYTSVHPALHSLLAARADQPVPGWRLRLLTADQVHTERRTRELRDLGYKLMTWEAEDENWYQLSAHPPNLRYAAAFQLRRNALDSRKIRGQRQEYLVGLAERTALLPPRKNQGNHE